MPHQPHIRPQIHHKFLLSAATALTLLLTPSTPIPAQTSTPDLQRLFQNPPDDAKPMVRWWWFGSAVEKPEILRELQQMKADGIGGVELAFVYPEVIDSEEHKNLSFLSPEMLDCVKYAQEEARKLGLRVDVTMGSGWPYGGPSTTLEEAATRLRTLELPLPAGTTSLPSPKLADGESILSIAIAEGDPKAWNPATAQPAKPFITSNKPRTALFFLQSHTLQQVKRAAVGAEGYVLDPFSKQAVATHLKTVGEPLVRAFGPTPPYAVFSDSLEAYGADWTPTLPVEFKKRRGYDLLPHLPELVAGGTPAAEKVRHDYGTTLTELVNENYLTQIDDWAKMHHTKFRSQTYGTPAVSFSSQRLAALPEGEGPQWRAFSTLRWATSANHVFGNTITSGETFTWLHSPVFRATPLDMKAEADIDFIMGENQLIFHGWPYSPPPSQLPPGDPGWSLYAAAVFNDHNPWHSVMPAVDAYIARLSALLRQGQPANQVAILLPTDDALATFAPGRVSITGTMGRLVPKEIISAILSAGYNFDFIDADAIHSVGLGTHRILVIPPTDRLPVSTLNKILDYEKGGGKVICVGRRPSITPDGKPLPLMAEGTRPATPTITSRELLFSSPNTLAATTPSELGSVLPQAMPPDLDLGRGHPSIPMGIGFVRRKLPNADIYFLANTTNRQLSAFPVTFASTHPYAEQWDPENATATPISVKSLTVSLAPYESRLFVFTDSPSGSGTTSERLASKNSSPKTATSQRTDLSTGWTLTLAGKPAPASLPSDWSTNPATLHYSGEAIYSRDFTLATLPKTPILLEIEGGQALPGAPNSPPEHAAAIPEGTPNPLVTLTGPGMHAYYDPPIREAALVTLNGQPAGALWHPPYTLDVSKFLKPGLNKIEIHVFNTALNAWSANPPRDYKPLIAKYGDRFQMQDLDKVQPLPSGILGTIHLVTEGESK